MGDSSNVNMKEMEEEAMFGAGTRSEQSGHESGFLSFTLTVWRGPGGAAGPEH